MNSTWIKLACGFTVFPLLGIATMVGAIWGSFYGMYRGYCWMYERTVGYLDKMDEMRGW